MRACLIVLLAASATCVAADNVQFFESWQPRPALRDLWAPLRESWWDANRGFGSPRVAEHFKAFARHRTPEAILPEIFADLKIHRTELTEIGYTYLLGQWPRKRVLRLLQHYRHSRDPDVKKLAESFHDDLLQWEAEQT
jgi:hypothetical protein